MEIISLQEANCKLCHHCVRVCPTKAISFANGKPEIIEEECILCGACYVICPHDAKQVNTDMAKVLAWSNSGIKLVASLAPSYVSLQGDFPLLKETFKQRGFFDVQETARGAASVSARYLELMHDGTERTMISTCCPAIVTLVETRYPDLVDLLAPVVSPMVAHGIQLKQQYPDAKVVFVSPCAAKIKEAADPIHKGIVDAVISMQDIETWFNGNEKPNFDFSDRFEGEIARLYPTGGGIIETMAPKLDGINAIHIEGVERAGEVLESIRNGYLNGSFIEMNACIGSCLKGPLLHQHKQREFASIQNIRRSNPTLGLPHANAALYRIERIAKPLVAHMYTESQIREVLKSLGKMDKEKELNCGACGYPTCREKAIAVLDKKADPHLCLPFALEKAESMSNAVIEHTPNGVLVVDNELNVLEINPSGMDLLNCRDFPIKGFPVSALLPNEQLLELLHDSSKVHYIQAEYEHYHRTFQHAIVPMKDENCSVIILMDLTDEKLQQVRLKEYRKQTLSVTQEVLDEQMRTVQEIASLLGETTAKSKIALTRLKKSVEDE